MKRLHEEEKACRRCVLRTTCHQVVPGQGPVPSALMLVGEAPGADEDAVGIPFVGMSGKLLDRMLKSADLSRSDIFITNVCRCRPPGNRTPEASEINACKAWLWREIRVCDPLVIVAMGGTAAKLLLRGNSSFRISKVVDQAQKVDFLRQGGIVVPAYHPSYLLHNNMDKLEGMVKTLIKVQRYIVANGDKGVQN
jgi:uracil-DNA glycosylase family 4